MYYRMPQYDCCISNYNCLALKDLGWWLRARYSLGCFAVGSLAVKMSQECLSTMQSNVAECYEYTFL